MILLRFCMYFFSFHYSRKEVAFLSSEWPPYSSRLRRRIWLPLADSSSLPSAAAPRLISQAPPEWLPLNDEKNGLYNPWDLPNSAAISRASLSKVFLPITLPISSTQHEASLNREASFHRGRWCRLAEEILVNEVQGGERGTVLLKVFGNRLVSSSIALMSKLHCFAVEIFHCLDLRCWRIISEEAVSDSKDWANCWITLSSTGDSWVEGNLVSFNSDSSLGYSHLNISIFFSTVVSISSTVIGQIVSSKANSGSTEWSCFINTVVWEWNHVSKPWHSLVSTHISWHRRR